jgi:hypothetical protein
MLGIVGGLNCKWNSHGSRVEVVSPVITKTTRRLPPSRGKVLKSMALAGSPGSIHQWPAPKLTMLGIVGGLNCKWNSHGSRVEAVSITKIHTTTASNQRGKVLEEYGSCRILSSSTPAVCTEAYNAWNSRWLELQVE